MVVLAANDCLIGEFVGGTCNVALGLVPAAEVWLGVVVKGPFLATKFVDGVGSVALKVVLAAGVWLEIDVERPANAEATS